MWPNEFALIIANALNLVGDDRGYAVVIALSVYLFALIGIALVGCWVFEKVGKRVHAGRRARLN